MCSTFIQSTAPFARNEKQMSTLFVGIRYVHGKNTSSASQTTKQLFRTTRMVAQEIENLQRQHDNCKKQNLVHSAPVEWSRCNPFPCTFGVFCQVIDRLICVFCTSMYHTKSNTKHYVQNRQAPKNGRRNSACLTHSAVVQDLFQSLSNTFKTIPAYLYIDDNRFVSQTH